MSIPVIYVNGSPGVILVQDLDDLLEMKLITAFRRASGWVTVGRDVLRSSRSDDKGSWRDRKSQRLQLTM